MSLLDRMVNRNLAPSPEDSPETSTTLALGEAPILGRIRTLTQYFTESIGKNRMNGSNKNKVVFMLNKLIADAMDEARDVPPEFIELHMQQAVSALYWATTGSVLPGMHLPDDFPVQPEPERHLTAVAALEEGVIEGVLEP